SGAMFGQDFASTASLPLQLLLQRREEAPVGPLRHDLLRGRLDHPDLMQAQSVEADGVLGAVLAPLAVGDFAQGLIGAPPRGQPWTSAVTLLPGRNGLIAWRMAVWWTFREPSLCRHVHRELLSSVWLDLTPIIAPTACHQRNYVERYSRCMTTPRSGRPSAS